MATVCFDFEIFEREGETDREKRKRRGVWGGGLPPGKGIKDIAPDTLVRLG